MDTKNVQSEELVQAEVAEKLCALCGETATKKIGAVNLCRDCRDELIDAALAKGEKNLVGEVAKTIATQLVGLVTFPEGMDTAVIDAMKVAGLSKMTGFAAIKNRDTSDAGVAAVVGARTADEYEILVRETGRAVIAAVVRKYEGLSKSGASFETIATAIEKNELLSAKYEIRRRIQ